MIFFLNRKVEQVIAGYLGKTLPGTMKVYRAMDLTPRQFPCAVVRCPKSMRFAGELHACQKFEVSIFVLTEMCKEINPSAQVLKEYEEIQEQVVSATMQALYIEDLKNQLEAIKIDGISISYAEIGDSEENPVLADCDEENGVGIVLIPLKIHAGAKEI